MRSMVSSSRVLIPALLLGLGPAALGLSACSRTDDRASDPAAGASPAASAGRDAAPVAGGPTTLKPGLWKTVTQTPAGPEDSVQCVPEGYDPGAEAARKVSPCGNPEVTRTVDGFRIDLSCEKNHITYTLDGTVKGDFVTTADTDLNLVVSAFGRKQTLHMKAVSTYQGDCAPDGRTPGETAGRDAGQNAGKSAAR